MDFIKHIPNYSPVKITGVDKITSEELVFITNAGKLLIEAVNQNTFRIRLINENNNFDFKLVKDYQPQEIKILDQEKLSFQLANFDLTINREPLSFAITWQNKKLLVPPTDGHFIREYRIAPVANLNNNFQIAFDLNDDEKIYGTGEQWSSLNLRHKLVTNFNEDSLGGNTALSYKNIPFVWSTNSWGLFFNTTATVNHAIAYPQIAHRSYVANLEDDLDLFIFAGETPQKLINSYYELTGYPNILPEWTLKPWLSKAFYKDEDELMRSAKTMKMNNLDCQTIVLDGRTWQDTNTRFAFEWDKSRYPDPSKTIANLKELGYKVCVWLYPLTSIHNSQYQELKNKGLFLKDETGDTLIYKFDAEPFGKDLSQLPDSSIIDFTNKDACTWWIDNCKKLIAMGIDAIKTDFGEQVPNNAVASNGVRGKKLHNVYAYLYNQTTAMAFEKNQAVLWARSAWSGSQKYPSHWCGDSQSDWGGLKTAIRGCLQWTLSGGAYTSSDIGGFFGGPPSSELYIRWLEFGALSALMRFHGIGHREPYFFGEEATQVAKKFLKIREELMPYLIEHSKNVTKGIPLMRPMIWEYPDSCPAEVQTDLQYLLGDKYFVAPITNESSKIKFWLPPGTWENYFDDNEVLTGDQWISKTYPLDELAFFIKR